MVVTNDSDNHTFASSNASVAVIIPKGAYFTSSQLLNGGAFKAQLLGRTGNRSTIQASSDFSSWAPLTTITNEAGTFEFTDLSATNASRRFYRVVLEP